jgi:apolipoprotein D and lipocalin family protein
MELDVAKYAGTWYEVARVPNLFEVGCAQATATYLPINGTQLSVDNRCYDATGNLKRSSKGVATQVGSQSFYVDFGFPSKSKTANYRILFFDSVDYEWAVVGGSPSSNLAWVLSRVPIAQMDSLLLDAILLNLRTLGYPPLVLSA